MSAHAEDDVLARRREVRAFHARQRPLPQVGERGRLGFGTERGRGGGAVRFAGKARESDCAIGFGVGGVGLAGGRGYRPRRRCWWTRGRDGARLLPAALPGPQGRPRQSARRALEVPPGAG